jgi:hypothetical protein
MSWVSHLTFPTPNLCVMGVRFRLLIFLRSPYYAINSSNVLNLIPEFREQVLLVVCYDVICDGLVIPNFWTWYI